MGIVERDVTAGPGRAAAERLFAGTGEMRARCRALDWAATPLGRVDEWPAPLRAAADLVMASGFATTLCWGPSATLLFNDASARAMGPRHASALGRPVFDAYPESRSTVEPIHARVRRGETVMIADRAAAVPGSDGDSAAHYTISYAPVRDEDGAVAGVLVVGVETTQRLHAESSLRATEESYRTLFSTMREGLCVIELLFDDAGHPHDYRFLEANPAFVQQTGLADAIGRTVRELVPALDARWIEIYGRVATTGEPVWFEDEAVALGRWYDVNAMRVGAPHERKVAILFNDISARKRAERERERLLAERAAERERLQSLILHMPAPVALLTGPEHRHELVNDAFRRISGGGRDVTGLTVREAFLELEGQGIFERLDHVYATGEPWMAPESLVRHDRDGTGIRDTWYHVRFEPVRDADGRVAGILNFAIDVTEQVVSRREVERLLGGSERALERTERLQALTAALARARTLEEVGTVVVADMVLALGARTGALAARAPEGDGLVLLRTVGFPAPVADGVRRQSPDFRSPLVECFRTQQPLWIERRDGPDGLDVRYPPIAPVWDALGVASAAFIPLVAAGEPVGVISFAFVASRTFAEPERDFLQALGHQAALAFERARLFEAERAARAEAEAANRSKAEFLATMSHELRTPLNAIGGYAELMEMGIRGPVTAQQAEDLRRIQASQRHLLGLVNEVLNYARIETGTVHYDIADVPIMAVVAAVEPLIAPQLAAKGLDFVVRPCDPVPVARADREKVRQVLLNLLSNAVKFTDAPGRVEVWCEAAGGRVLVHVRDTGIGIAPDEQARVFEPFVQVNASLTRTHEGTGLGLAISRDLARGMGGELTVESVPGRGSTFTLALPRA